MNLRVWQGEKGYFAVCGKAVSGLNTVSDTNVFLSGWLGWTRMAKQQSMGG